MTTTRPPRSGRLRFAPLAVAVGAVSSAVLGLSATGTLSAFTAQINNGMNTAASGTLIMTETGTNGTSGTCASSQGSNGVSACSTINKFGGGTGLIPGGPASTAQVTIANTGSAAASTFTLAPTNASPTCTQADVGTASGTAGDACARFNLRIESGSTVIYDGAAGSLGAINLAAVTPVGGGPVVNLTPGPSPAAGTPFKFSVTLPAGTGNAYQGKQISLPLTWAFGAGS